MRPTRTVAGVPQGLVVAASILVLAAAVAMVLASVAAVGWAGAWSADSVVPSVLPEAHADHVDSRDYYRLPWRTAPDFEGQHFRGSGDYVWRHESHPAHKPTPEWYTIRDIGTLWDRGRADLAVGEIQHMIDDGYYEVAFDVPFDASGNITARLPYSAVAPIIQGLHGAVDNNATAAAIFCPYAPSFCPYVAPPPPAPEPVRPATMSLIELNGTVRAYPINATGAPVYLVNNGTTTIVLDITGPAGNFTDSVRGNSTLAYAVPGTYGFATADGRATIVVLSR